MKNKKFLIILGIAIVVAIGGVMYFKTAGNQQASVATSLLGGTVLSDTAWRNLCLDRKPHLEILSPDGGETYLETDTITLKWRSCNLSSEIYVDGRIEGYTEGRTMIEHVDLKFTGSSEINYDLTKNDGQQDFTLAAWDLPVSSTGFKVILETRGTTGSPVASDRSDNLFFIKPNWDSLCADGKPHIRVVSPNGGEMYTAGQQVTVKWKSCNISGNITEINLTSTRDNGWGWTPGGSSTGKYIFTQNTTNDGQEVVILPNVDSFSTAGTVFGKYFKIEINTSDSIINDLSDNLFTISR